MLTSPYSIYVNKRPLRTAFLVEDKLESMATIDAILSYSRDRWGGRYNPIVLTDGQTFTKAWWSLLEAIDPDVVASVMPLSDELVARLERGISPYLIHQMEQREQGNIHLIDDGLTLLPTPLHVRKASWAIGQSSLVLFETDWRNTDPLIKRFIDWNFGGYTPATESVTRALEGVRTQPYTITDAASLVTPLTELTTFRAFTYPIQLCSLPSNALPPVQHDRFDDTFHVVIGDTPADVAYFWNRPATTPQWSRTYLNQVWLPLDVATNPALTTSLGLWLQRCADPNGSHKGSVRFVSLSLPQAHLQEVAEPLTRHITRVFRDVEALAGIQPPKISEGPPGPLGIDRMDLYRATSTTERVTLQEPEIPLGFHLGEHWMADLYIEFRPERYPMVSGRPLWWQLPRLNALASHMFRRQSRIMRSRYPSVLMKRGEPRLDISLPDDISAFAGLATLPNQAHYTLDTRQKRNLPGRTPYYGSQRSEKGRYLSGLLDLFGGLYPAASTLEERYWRRMFDLLSGRSDDTDSERLKEVGNTLRKRLGANRATFYEDDKAMSWLTSYVLKVARSLPALSRDLEFRVFEEQAKQELEAFKVGRADHERWAYSQNDLMRVVADLTERGVLLMGVQARCSSCGYREWHHLDDARQTLRCGGCNATFPMPPEPRWHYRLNSLARAAHSQHGLLPVVLVLGQLHMDARTAFLFAPCLDVFEDDDKGPVGDLDIAVILDGQFVVGEIKQSRELFDEATFVKMETIARRLLPDVLLFASMDREPTRLIADQISRLSTALEPERITVKWYRLHEYKFAARPVR